MLWFRTTVDALFDMLHRSRRYGQIEESAGERFNLKSRFSLRLAPLARKETEFQSRIPVVLTKGGLIDWMEVVKDLWEV